MKNKSNKIELLAPAGDFSRLKYALAYGADAVYLGLPEFSLRAKTGLDLSSLQASINYAHKLKKKAYVTVNIFAHEGQIKALPKFLAQLKACQPDAIILSDPGALALVRKRLPQVAIHLSTQANTLNSEAVKFWQKAGVSRVILGRETSLADILAIHKAVPKIELEIFAHGAMCLSYSGRCYLSAEFSKRSANLGECTQPCRWKYKLYAEETTRPGKLLPIVEDDEGMHIFNSKDLCLIEHLDELIKAGIVSFKIEGRTKSVFYVASVVNAYRQALDNLGDKKIRAAMRRELQKVDNRGYTEGFLVPTDPLSRQNFDSSKAQSEWQVVGEVVSQHGRQAEIKIHNSLAVADELELIAPGRISRLKLKSLAGKQGERVSIAHGGTDHTYLIDLPAGLNAAWGLIRKKL